MEEQDKKQAQCYVEVGRACVSERLSSAVLQFLPFTRFTHIRAEKSSQAPQWQL